MEIAKGHIMCVFSIYGMCERDACGSPRFCNLIHTGVRTPNFVRKNVFWLNTASGKLSLGMEPASRARMLLCLEISAYGKRDKPHLEFH
jgi:hypothetical protein